MATNGAEETLVAIDEEMAVAAKQRGTTTRDPELVVLARIGNLLASLSEAERKRVLGYLMERFEELLSD
jgi:hypothetical protein